MAVFTTYKMGWIICVINTLISTEAEWETSKGHVTISTYDIAQNW